MKYLIYTPFTPVIVENVMMIGSYPKILLARTKNPQYDLEGIQVIDIADWLLGR